MTSNTVKQAATNLANQTKYFNNLPTSPYYPNQFDFEKSFKHEDARAWMTVHWIDSVYWSILYVAVIFGGKYLMANREPFKLRKVLFIWNLALAMFSIAGSMRMIPEMYYVLKNFGFDYSVCKESYVTDSPVSGYWTFAFALSKVPELGDTVFIILRKQNLIFLHWYHHITVLIFTWYSYFQHIAPARWYIDMNYVIHSCMYTYYACRAIGIRLPKPLAMLITLSQIAQMIMGFYVTYYSYVNAATCSMPVDVSIYGLLMYGSYFVLFANFFINSYFLSSKSKLKSDVNGNSKIDNNNIEKAKKIKKAN